MERRRALKDSRVQVYHLSAETDARICPTSRRWSTAPAFHERATAKQIKIRCKIQLKKLAVNRQI